MTKILQHFQMSGNPRKSWDIHHTTTGCLPWNKGVSAKTSSHPAGMMAWSREKPHSQVLQIWHCLIYIYILYIIYLIFLICILCRCGSFFWAESCFFSLQKWPVWVMLTNQKAYCIVALKRKKCQQNHVFPSASGKNSKTFKKSKVEMARVNIAVPLKGTTKVDIFSIETIHFGGQFWTAIICTRILKKTVNISAWESQSESFHFLFP